MSGVRVAAVILVWASMMLAALPGCAGGSAADDGGGDQLPAAGEEGGACVLGEACGQGLVCVDGICVSDPDPEPEDSPDAGEGDGDVAEVTLLMFHNNSGPMCLAALEWLATAQQEHAWLAVEEHLTTESAEVELLRQLEAEYSESEGVSASFRYLPIIFFTDHAFSGFDDEVAEALETLVQEVDEGTP
ncbi:MAG TPA: hypothetical protein PKK06_07220 [Phycisphaerae bacterium]|nr:hypothetical protein [Phycisphaerae bacterium]HNU45069.1 hypothetical protein [Phycisphaerae bacterium]